MPLDICAPADSDRETVSAAVDKTNRWLLRCVDAHTRSDQRLFGIVQGGLFPELRRKSAQFITSVGFPGYSIGGLSVGESKQAMYDTVEYTAPLLPEDAPRYLMGVGSPEDLVEVRGARHRHVRLCAAYAGRPQRRVVRARGQAEHHGGKIQAQVRAGRRGLRLLHLSHILGGVCASLVPREGTAGVPSGDDTQLTLHPTADGRDARRNNIRRIRRIPPRVPQPLHAAGRARPPRAKAKVASLVRPRVNAGSFAPILSCPSRPAMLTYAPPATAGTMLTSSPLLVGVPIPSRKRTSSPLI